MTRAVCFMSARDRRRQARRRRRFARCVPCAISSVAHLLRGSHGCAHPRPAGAADARRDAARPGARSRPRSRGSPDRRDSAASAPMANEPAYQSGLSRLGRDCSSCRRVSHQARWSVSSRAACEQQLAGLLGARSEGLAVIQGLGGDLPGVVHPHEGGGRAALGLGKRRPAVAADGPGSGVAPPGWDAKLERERTGPVRARSAAASRRSSGVRGSACHAAMPLRSIIRRLGRPRARVALHWAGAVEYTSGPFFGPRICRPTPG